jgi:hypothetical protein
MGSPQTHRYCGFNSGEFESSILVSMIEKKELISIKMAIENNLIFFIRVVLECFLFHLKVEVVSESRPEHISDLLSLHLKKVKNDDEVGITLSRCNAVVVKVAVLVYTILRQFGRRYTNVIALFASRCTM